MYKRQIDIDATDGFGPEIFATPNAIRGAYQVYANYYGGNSDQQVITRCKIAIISDENTPNEKQQNFIVPLRKAGELTLVKSFIYWNFALIIYRAKITALQAL